MSQRIGDLIGSEYDPDAPYTPAGIKRGIDYADTIDRLARELFGDREEFSGRTEWKPTHDLLRPPGLVGEVAQYINSQSRYPRENLAVISAIVAIGNIGGLYYRIRDSKLTSNLFAFCVAGSATGKEAILQATNDIHIEAGLAAAIHGSIKSEQEIMRNLIRHQAAFYIIDELGIFMRKLNMSHKSGGASYLQGVIGTLMAAYSKGNGNMLLSGDVKEEIKADLNREYASLNKRADDGQQGLEARMEAIVVTLNNIDNGLKNPFLSMIGFSTPSTFNECVSFEQVTSGFIGRSLIINEPDTNPKRKKGFIAPDMPQSLIDKIQSLVVTGDYDSSNKRIQAGSQYKYITTTPEAQQALEDAADWFEDEADKHTERTGFEAVVRRGYEMVEKISFILSIGSTERGLEDVEWANEYVRRDIEYKTLLAYSNVKEKSSPIESMAAKVLCSIDIKGTTIGQIANRYRVKKKLVEDAVNYLDRKGKIRTEQRENRFNKTQNLIIFAK